MYMKNILLLSVVIFCMSSCKKDDNDGGSSSPDKADKYVGTYNVSEDATILFNTTFNEHHDFVGHIIKGSAGDKIKFIQVPRTPQPVWVNQGSDTLELQITSVDSLTSTNTSFGYINNGVLHIQYYFGSGASVYDVKQTWQKQ